MAIIQIQSNPDIYYDTTLTWWEQSTECIELGQSTMLTPVTSEEKESATVDGKLHERFLSRSWNTTTSSGTFDFSVLSHIEHYMYPIESPAFLTKSKQDIITVTQLS